MKTVAVICEYNPFHRGHSIQIVQIREKYPDAVILSLMSGDFVQRGSPAVFPKYKRAETAVLCGSDLVLELPYPWSGAGAKYFAAGAVSVLQSLGCVEALAFGSESGDLSVLEKTAQNLRSEEFETLLQDALREAKPSESYVRTTQRVYEKRFGGTYPVKPNDILAAEYISAVRRADWDVTLCSFPRASGYSATSARRYLAEGDTDGLKRLLPAETMLSVAGQTADAENAAALILWTLRQTAPETTAGISEISPGMEYAVAKAAGRAETVGELVGILTGKRYTRARVRRAIRNILLRTTENMLCEKPAYTLLLAADSAGCALLSSIRKTAGIPILTKPADGGKLEGRAKEQFAYSTFAEELYGMMFRPPLPFGDSLTKTPFIRK